MWGNARIEKFRVLEDCPGRAIMTKPTTEGADIRVSTTLQGDRRIPEPTSFTLTQWCAGLCLVAQSRPTLCDPMDCSPSGSSVHGIPQARILEWIAVPSFRGSSRPRDRTQVSCIAGRLFTIWVKAIIGINIIITITLISVHKCLPSML